MAFDSLRISRGAPFLLPAITCTPCKADHGVLNFNANRRDEDAWERPARKNLWDDRFASPVPVRSRLRVPTNINAQYHVWRVRALAPDKTLFEIP